MLLTLHSSRAFSIDSLLEPEECEELIALAESRGFSSASVRTIGGPKSMPQVRNNERAMFEAAQWVSLIWQRLSSIELPVLDEQLPAGLPRDLRFYKYTPGQRFKMHKDGPWSEDGLISKLTLLVYLNDGFHGGETDFRQFRIAPKTGSALLFVHDTWHEGGAVDRGVKYVLRSDVLYSPVG